MKKYFVFFLVFLFVLALSGQTVAAEKPTRVTGLGTSPAFLQGSSTASQRGIFAPYVVSWPARQFDTAFSIANTLAAPPYIQGIFDAAFGDLVGTIEFYFWDLEGELYTYETGPESPGRGLNEEGMLSPGRSYLVLMNQILKEAGYDYEAHDGLFAGYLWIVANFDGVQGTSNPTDFKLFTQTTVMQPDLGTTFFDFSANAGVPMIPPPDGPEPK